MAHKTVATRWLLSLRNQIPVSFVEHKWGKGEFTDIEVQINFNNKIFSGRGTDRVGDIAIEKASGEAIERWCCDTLGISTVGCALRSDESFAKQNAESELIERVIFSDFIENGGLAQELSSITVSLSDKLRFWAVGSKIVVAIAFTEGKPLALGIANEEKSELGVEKAKLEALRNLAAFKFDPIKFKEITENDHNFWCCDPQFLKKLMDRLENSLGQEIILPKLNVTTQKVDSVLGIEGCDQLYFARATAEGTR